MPAIETEDLTKDYFVGFWRPRPYRALDRLTLSVDQGEVFGFLGPNGAGKSTTLKLLMGLIFPTAGRPASSASRSATSAMRRRIGFLPENPYFYDYLTAEELLTLLRELSGLRGADARAAWRRARRSRDRRRAAHAAALLFEGHDSARRRGAGAGRRAGSSCFFDEPMSGLDPLGPPRSPSADAAAARPRLHGVFQLAHPRRRRDALQPRRHRRAGPTGGARQARRHRRVRAARLGAGRDRTVPRRSGRRWRRACIAITALADRIATRSNCRRTRARAADAARLRARCADRVAQPDSDDARRLFREGRRRGASPRDTSGLS